MTSEAAPQTGEIWGNMVGWEQRGLGEAASLLRDRKLIKVKGSGQIPACDQHTAFGVIRACIFNWSSTPGALGSAVPPVESLKSKTT